MNEDRVPQSLLDAFERRADGTYAPRHLFGEDLLALLVAVVAPLVLAGLVLLTVALVHAIWDDDGDDGAAPARVAVVVQEHA